jgi:alpha-glucosidase
MLQPIKPLMIEPRLETLPVYVRGGSILPIEPVTQSTAETPKGPLTLRVYPSSDPAEPCAGEVYTDDGHSFNYRRGQYARIKFACSITPDGSLAVTIAAQEGSFTPWWSSYQIEVFGWSPKLRSAFAGSTRLPMERQTTAWTVTVPVNSQGETVRLQ